MATKLSVQLELQASQAKQTLAQLGQQAQHALNPNSKAFQKELETVNQLNARIKSLAESAQTFAKGGAASAAEYAKASQEIAALTKRLRDLTQDQATRNSLIEQEVKLRRQANEATGGSGNLSAHSQRQAGQLSNVQSLIGQIRSGGVGGSAGDLVSAGGLAGAGVAAAGLAALAIGAKKVLDAFGELAAKSRETAKSVSDKGGSYDKTDQGRREREKEEGLLGQNPLFAAIAQGQDWLGKQLAIGTRTILEGLGSRPAAADKSPLSLKGDEKLGLEGLDRNRANTLQSMALERQDAGRGIFEQRRDYEQQIVAFQLDSARKREDTERAIADKRFAMETRLARLNEDAAFNTSEKKFALDQAAAARDQGQKEQDAKEDFDRKRKFDQEAFRLSQADKGQDYSNTRADKLLAAANSLADKGVDFANSMADKAADFGLATRNRGQDTARNAERASQDRRDQLTDQTLSGASGLQYLQSSRDYRKSAGRAAEDAQREQARAEEAYNLEKSRSGRDYGLNRGQTLRDLTNDISQSDRDRNLDVSRSGRDNALKLAQGAEEFNTGQDRSRRDFQQKQGDSQAQHALEVEQHYTELRYQQIDLEREMSLATRDATTALSRLAEDYGIGKQALSNKGSDLDYSTASGQAKLAMSQRDQLQGLTDADRGFASGLIGKYDPATLSRLAGGNPRLAAMLAEYGKASGIMPDLGGTSSNIPHGAFSADPGSWGGSQTPLPAQLPAGTPMAVPAPVTNVFQMGDININGDAFTKADAEKLNRDIREFAERRARQIQEENVRMLIQNNRMRNY
jgi:hypothetical protein